MGSRNGARRWGVMAVGRDIPIAPQRVMRGCTGDEVEQEEHDHGSAQRTVTMARRDRIGTGPRGEGERTIARENGFYYHTGCNCVPGVLGMASMGDESNEMIIFRRYRMREPRFRRLR